MSVLNKYEYISEIDDEKERRSFRILIVLKLFFLLIMVRVVAFVIEAFSRGALGFQPYQYAMETDIICDMISLLLFFPRLRHNFLRLKK